MTHTQLKIALVVACAGVCGAAQAQIRPAYNYPTQPAGGIQLGQSPAFFSPYVGFGAGYDSNVLLSKNNERSSKFGVLSPGFRVDARSPHSVLQLDQQWQIGRYADSHNDDYNDNSTHASADVAFNQRTFGRAGFDYISGHDPRGSTDRAISPKPDEYKVFSPNATFAFGAPGAQGRVETYYSFARKRYDNNRSVTIFSDRDTSEYGAAFYMRVGPKTYGLVEARQTDIDYKVANANSGRERRFYGGVSWEATALTTGTLKVGQLKREFDGPVPSQTATSWEGYVTWAPRTYSTFQLLTSRQTSESTGLGHFILTEAWQLSWNHQWTNVWQTGVSGRWQRDEYQGFDRRDDTSVLGLRVGYKARRWLTLGAEYTYTKRDSNLNFDYDKNFYLLTATIAP